MPSLKDLRSRIASVKSTQKITRAMKMVAASKLRRAQEAAEAARPYAEAMDKMMRSLAASVAGNEMAPPLLRGTGKDDVHLIIVATSDRGLCGGFNSSIVRAVRRRIAELQERGKTVKLFTVNRKGRDQLRREYGQLIIDRREGVGARRVEYGEAMGIVERLQEMFEAGEFDVATIVYNRFKSVISQEVTFHQLIPFAAGDGKGETAGFDGAVYEFEPDETEILAELLPRNLGIQVFRALLENAASEQGARMTAMDNATRNAGEMIDDLSLQYNRTRQAVITKELIEIISGAEAL